MPSNFSRNQQTGAISEDEVGLHFTRWGWSVGRDRIDTGYDLFVEPDRARYRGSRFLVQVKGTTQRRRSAGLIAPVDKSRLVEYARNPHAVFLIRATSDGRFYWLHIQEWAKHNRSRLSGSGIARIPMDSACDLSDRNAFESYLDKILAPASDQSGALASMAEERATTLSAIDPHFLVRVNVNNGREEHEIFAKSESAQAKLTFQPDKRVDNVSNLKDALEFGLPRKVDVSQFKMSGSPLFEALGVNRPHVGTLTIQGKPRKGAIRIHPGRTFSPLAQCLEIKAELFSGQTGIAVSSEAVDGLFQVEGRFGAPGKGTTTLSLRQSMLTSTPIQDLTELAAAGTWAEQVFEEQTMFLELVFDGRRVRLPSPNIPLDGMVAWLYRVRLLSRLHLIAKCLDLNFVVPPNCVFSEEETADIAFAYQLLRGARLSGGSVSMEFETTAPMNAGKSSHGFWATTNFVLTVNGKDFATLPIAIELPDYTAEPIPNSSRLRIHHPGGGEAWVTYAPDGPDDIFVRRITKTDH